MALKEKALKRLTEKLNAAGIPFAIGGSWMLCQRGLLDTYHDFDVFVSMEDAERADRVLTRLGMRHAEETKVGFIAQYHFDGADVELLAGLPVGTEAVYSFSPEAVDGTGDAFGVPVPLLCLEDMYVIYAVGGRAERLQLIERVFAEGGLRHPGRFTACIDGPAPAAVLEAIERARNVG